MLTVIGRWPTLARLIGFIAAPRRRLWLAALGSAVVFVVAFLAAAQANIDRHGSLDFPPIEGGGDQLDYNIMAYTLASEGFPGRIVNQGMRQPFLQFDRERGDEITERQRTSLNRFLQDRNDTEPQPYAYRPWLYPLALGMSYKLFGYDFVTGRCVNLALFAASAAISFLAIFLFISRAAAIIFCGVFFSIDGLAQRTTEFLTEPSVALALSLLLCSLLLTARNPRNLGYALLFGVMLGVCMLAKQTFAPLGALMLAAFSISALRDTDPRSALRCVVAATLGACVIAGPWAAYNIATTRHVSLLTGTSGWHDMPSAYDVRIVEGRNRFHIREEIFEEYAQRHDVQIKGDVARALYGRKIFYERMLNGEYRSTFWRLFWFKVNDELKASPLEWLFRVLAIAGLAQVLPRAAFPLCVAIFGSVALFGLTISVGGRNFDAYWPLIAALAAISLAGIARLIWKSA